MRYGKLWAAFILTIVVSLGVLGYYGFEIYRQMPPIPSRVVADDGSVLYTREDIQTGQNVWQSMGGQEVGSVWGHGAYLAPDWSADWLHREAEWLLDHESQARYRVPLNGLRSEQRAALDFWLKQMIRANTYDVSTGEIRLTAQRAIAAREVANHYERLFSDDPDPDLVKLRLDYGLHTNALKTPEARHQLGAFFWWATWACVTERPGQEITYTNNWPPEPLVGNVPTANLILWTGFSVMMLLAGVGLLAWYFAAQRVDHGDDDKERPDFDPLRGLKPTPSMQATLKYFWTCTALLLLQIAMGIITAHYGVEGDALFGLPIGEWLPYVVTRTWHQQLGIFWIATAWLATGLFVAPAVSGYEPKGQKFGVNFLYVCLVVIVLGSMAGQWLSVMQKMDLVTSWWFGHQGWEYLDLGRFWQWFLFIGLFLWLFLMGRALWPMFRQPGDHKHLLALFLVASAAIAMFYGAGLMIGRHTHMAMAEYWRWWVVHLWVEGYFEVFATVVIAFLFTRLGLLRTATATAAVLFSCTIFLFGGMIGTFHHLYFSGTPTAVLALGATFSALEVVPLVLIGFEGYENLWLTGARPWVKAYRWPILFFVAVAFWNMVGAGIFGFMINPPIALYYVQGLNTTPVHGHTALFGVYGMLGIGLMLFCLKAMNIRFVWRTKVLAAGFWMINLGLATMVLLSLLPIGLIQAVASVKHGMWYARSTELLQSPLMHNLRWARVPGDILFGLGVVALAWFVIGLKTGWSVESYLRPPVEAPGAWAECGLRGGAAAPPTPAGACGRPSPPRGNRAAAAPAGGFGGVG